LLYAEASQEGVSTEQSPVRSGIDPETVQRVWKSGGELSLAEALRCRVRYFVDGTVLGSRQFADEIFRAYRARFGLRRAEGAQPLRGIATSQLGGLFTLRNWRSQTVG
jgi:hypothetical protein